MDYDEEDTQKTSGEFAMFYFYKLCNLQTLIIVRSMHFYLHICYTLYLKQILKRDFVV